VIRALAMLGAIAGCGDDGGPRLDAVSPASAPRGTMVTVEGRRLCGEPSNCETAAGEIQVGLELPAVKANVVEYADTMAVIVVPDLAKPGASVLIVTVNERTSNALDFEVLP
jgi:hypothetical protein